MRLVSAVAALGLLAPTFAVAAPPAAAALKERPGVWAQDYVPRPADPNVRFGKLSNGMRYAVMRNATPKGAASVRLYVAAGSLDETDEQQGLAHFLEHMAFKGSDKFPGDDNVVKTLERMGLAFGADTNAGTSFDQTVYKYDLPHLGPNDLSTALSILRGQAGDLTLSQAAMDPERGVVLSEERLRDTPGYQAGKAQIAFFLDGQRAPSRWPIGQTEVLTNAPVSQIRAFYEAHYRPEECAVVAVGDFDPAVVEAQIKSRFSDWMGKGAPPPRAALGVVKPRGSEVRLFSRAGVTPSVQVVWVGAYDDSADTFAHERSELVRELGLSILSRRLSTLAQGERPPFIAAGASFSPFVHSAQLASIGVTTAPERWREGLVATLIEQRRIERFGVTKAELDREIAESRAALVNASAGAATRRTPQLADAIVRSASDATVFSSPAQDLAEFEQAVKTVTAAEVSGKLKTVFSGSGPLVFVSSPTPIEGGEAAVTQALKAAHSVAVTPPAVQAVQAWPYEHLGPTATVTARREVKDLGVTFATLSNGVRVSIKPTAFRKDQVLVAARFGHGRLGLPTDAASTTWAAPNFLIQGGTRELTNDQIDRLGASRVASTSLSLQDDAWALAGATRPQDLAFQMQLMAAYLSRPGFRPEAFRRTQASALQVADTLGATPSGVLGRDFGLLTHAGDKRWEALPGAADIKATTPEAVRALLEPAMSGDPVDVVIVGDVTVEAALAVAARTFGALPKRHGPTKPAAAGLDTRFPAAGRVERLHTGRADQAVALVAWPTQDLFADPQTARATGMATEILQLRLTDQLRGVEGSTYSPAAQSTNSEVFAGYGFVFAQVETPPAKIASFFANVDRIAASLAAAPPTADELIRAREPRIEQRRKNQETNEYWATVLARAQADPRELQMARDLVPGTQKVTSADVQVAAARFLRPETAWRVVVRAADPAPGAPVSAPIGPATPPRPPVVKPDAQPPAPGSQTKTGSTTAAPQTPPA
ncbi:insulinase family protein [soil metagenome]